MSNVQITVNHFKVAGMVDFLSPEEQELLTPEDLVLIEKIEGDIMPGGFIIDKLTTHHDVRYNEKPKRSATFIHWSAIRELATDDSTLFFHLDTSAIPFKFDNPVVLKGAYQLFGWHVKEFLTHPAPIPHKMETALVDAKNVKYTTDE